MTIREVDDSQLQIAHPAAGSFLQRRWTSSSISDRIHQRLLMHPFAVSPRQEREDIALNPRSPLIAGLPTRRDLLRVGSLSVAANLLPTQWTGPLAAHASTTAASADSVIYLWMGGGVTHIDSFDPKPEAPEEIRGTLSAIDTTLPGVQFGEPMPELAKIADDLCLVRSYSHDSNDHLLSQVYTLSGRKVGAGDFFSEPNIGSVVSHLLGPRNGLPGYIAVPGFTYPGPPPHNLFVGGWVGAEYAPFCVGGRPDQPDFVVGEKLDNPPAEHEEDLRPRELAYPAEMTAARLSSRVSLRESIESAARVAEAAAQGGVDENYESALNLLTSPSVREAFDLSAEPPSVRETYGRTKIGGRCLLARRLVEAGARYVMVDYGYDPDYGNLWDIHNAASQNFPHVSEMCKRGYHLAGIDSAFAALISDLKQRGQLERTLVVFLTEFGRTPKINANGGRDHWGMCGSVFFTGGGVQTGQVIGATDETAAWPVTQGYGPADIAATIYGAIGIDADARILDQTNRPHPVLDHGQVIDGVL